MDHAQPAPPSERPQILLLSTEPAARERLRLSLEALGYAAVAPPHPRAALTRLRGAALVLAAGWDHERAVRDVCAEIRSRYPLLPQIGLLPPGTAPTVPADDPVRLDSFVSSAAPDAELALHLEAQLRACTARRDAAHTAAQLRALADSSHVALFVLRRGRFQYVNARFAELFGYPAEAVSRLGFHHLIADEDQRRVGSQIASWLQGERSTLHLTCRANRRNGSSMHVEVHGSSRPVGGVLTFFGSVTDIGRLTRAQEELVRSGEYFRALIEGAEDMITVIDAAGVVKYESPSVEAVLGHPVDELVGRNVFDFIHHDDLPAARAALSQLMHTPDGVISTRCRFRDSAGSWRVLETVARYLVDDPAVGGIVLNTRDITDRCAAEDALRDSEQRYRLLVEESQEVFFYTHDCEHRFEYVSPSVEAVLGYSPVELVGRPYDVLLAGGDDDALVHQATDETLRTGQQAASYRARTRHRNGAPVTLELTESPLLRDGRVVGIQGFARDVSERDRMEAELRRAAFSDPLTGLPNRALFVDRLEHAGARMQRHPDQPFAVLFLDLDRFKVVNDSLGHEVGDQLLLAVAARLTSHLRPEDTVARFGGDEFAILLEQAPTVADCTRVAQRVLTAIAEPFDLGGLEVFTTASMGIVYSGLGGVRPEHALRNADMAMYRAKAAGGGGYEMFDRAMHAQALLRLQLETELRRAIERDELCAHYQPVVELTTGRLAGFEALVRWNHPERGLVSPAEFISIAEETGLIVPLGSWMISTACRQLQQWQAEGGQPGLWVAVNLSGRQLGCPNLVEQVASTLAETGLAGSSLKLEITESVVVENTDRVIRTLAQLKRLGTQLYMDDFGTGYASLSYLHRLPLDGIKIDRSFVSGMHVDQRHALLVESILAMARGLGLRIVAEGIEEEVHARHLAAHGCDYGQGYLFSRPQPADQATLRWIGHPEATLYPA